MKCLVYGFLALVVALPGATTAFASGSEFVLEGDYSKEQIAAAGAAKLIVALSPWSEFA